MVGTYFELKTFSLKLDKMHDLPTKLSPTSTTQNNSSYSIKFDLELDE